MSFVAAIPLIGKVIDKIFPDKQAAAEAKYKLLELTQRGELAELDAETKVLLAGAENVKAEAQSESWLARNWRPLTMLTFAGIIVARFLGWTSSDISEAEYIALWEAFKIGMGGYVVGRTGEKIAKTIVPIFQKGEDK